MVQLKKSYGQHLLSDPAIIRRIVSSVPVRGNHVVEVGPGTGNLTEIILEHAPVSLLAIEKDPEMVAFLQERFAGNKVLQLELQDFTETDDIRLPENFCFISNLPYYITSEILTRLCNYRDRIIKAVVMTQFEYYQRLSAQPGSRDYSSISIYIRSFFDILPGFKVKKGSFFPQPKIDSYVFTLVPNTVRERIKNFDQYNRLVRSAFSQRRKQMASVLCRETYVRSSKEDISGFLTGLGHSAAARAEELSIDDFISLSGLIDFQP